MTRLLAAALTLALGACGGPKQDPAAAATPVTEATPPVVAAIADAGGATAEGTHETEGALSSKESKAVARTLARVSELRGLTATRPVPGVKLERDKLVGRVKDKALREYPADVLRREGLLLQMFGFAPPTFDYLNEMMTLLEAQLEGFYEPKTGTMYLAADLRGMAAKATLAHELVHALQDQRWDLKSRSTYRPGKSDETLALACLAEGDATSVMIDFAMHDQGRTALDLPDDMLPALMAGGASAAAVQQVPHILRTTLVAPYVDGLTFVNTLRRKGGWGLVDRAWSRPPTTTEQVLHLEKWESNEPAIAIEAPTARTLGGGWRRADEDTFGELGFALTFEEWLDRDGARRAAAGWGGDRSAIYTRDDELAFAVHARYDRLSFSERALHVLAPGLKRSLGKAKLDTPDALCFERADLGPLIVARKDRDLVLAAGPARMTQETWESTATCAQAKTWVTEILR